MRRKPNFFLFFLTKKRYIYSGMVVFLLGMLVIIPKGFCLSLGSQKVEVTLGESYASRYIWRGQDLYPDNDGAYQPSVNIFLPGFLKGTDVAFNVWGSFPSGKGHELAEELDYSLTFSRDISKLLSASAGYTYFDYPKANNNSDIQETWASLALSLPFDTTFNLFGGYDFKVTSAGPDAGWYYSWGLGKDFPLPPIAFFQKDQTANFSVTNWGNDGPGGLKPCVLYATELDLATTYTLGKFSITPKLGYIINHKKAINNGKEEFWGSLELGYVF